MCGIAGFVRLDQPAQSSLVRAMCGEIRHRGPDDEGVHVDGGCGIGMRRLSIIDLSSGHQPMSNEDGSIWIVFNGEIYNFRELRGELEAFGHRFSTSSGDRRQSDGAAECSPLQSGTDGIDRCSWPATALASSRCTTPLLATGS